MKILLNYAFCVLLLTAIATGCSSKKTESSETTVRDTTAVVTKDTAQVVTETTVERDTIKK